MVLSIAALLLVLGITFMHSIFGLFSGMINLVCSITSLVVTFGLTEWLTELLTRQGLSATYALPACFIGLFFLTHVVLRVLADNLIRGNVRVSMYLDWGGAAACGFVNAQIIVGMLVLGFLMLPWGGRVAMFSRYERQEGLDADKRVRFERNHVAWFLRPDEFAVGLFNLLSDGSLRGGTPLRHVYPDYAEWVFWTGNTVQPESSTAPPHDEKVDGWGDRGLRVVGWWEPKEPLTVRYRAVLPTKKDEEKANFKDQTFKPQPGWKLLGTRLTLLPGSADQSDPPYHRFRPSMIRIVGQVGSDPRHYPARVLGGADQATTDLRLADIDNNFALVGREEAQLDVYFEVEDGFEPRFVEYRRFARAPVSPAARQDKAPADRLMAKGWGTAGGGGLIGATGFIAAIIEDKTGGRSSLPFSISAAALRGAGCELVGDKLKSGRIAGMRTELAAIGAGAVKEFALPEGHRMFQLACKARTASTLAGEVFDYVGAVVNQYKAVSSSGASYPLAGYYAIVNRINQEYFELYITGEPDSPTFRGTLNFQSVTKYELREDDAVLGLLFYVPPRTIVRSVHNQIEHGIEMPGGGYLVD